MHHCQSSYSLWIVNLFFQLFQPNTLDSSGTLYLKCLIQSISKSSNLKTSRIRQLLTTLTATALVQSTISSCLDYWNSLLTGLFASSLKLIYGILRNSIHNIPVLTILQSIPTWLGLKTQRVFIMDYNNLHHLALSSSLISYTLTLQFFVPLAHLCNSSFQYLLPFAITCLCAYNLLSNTSPHLNVLYMRAVNIFSFLFTISPYPRTVSGGI